MISFLSVLLGSSVALSWVQGLPVSPRADVATVCNGHQELCSRSYGNVTFIGAHDSFAASTDTNPARVQTLDVASQLRAGARLLQAQSHDHDGDLHFCHTSCALFDGGKVVDYLKTVKTFMDGNPNEVVTLIVTNPEGLSIKDKWKPAFDDSGISDLAYVPKSLPVKKADWPTLGEMIKSGKRLVVFMDAKANTDEADFILPEFDMVWESQFRVTDPKFPECKVDRITGDLSPEDHMYMINHNLNEKVLGGLLGDGVTMSDYDDAETTNSVQSIMDNVAKCAPLAGNANPNFILLDFIEKGDGFRAADELNGVA